MATDGRRILRIYKILNGPKILGPPPFIKKCEEEMGTGGMKVDVCKILRLTHAISPDCSSLEMNYKCLARRYRTPDKLHQFQREASNLCWRGCAEIRTMFHIWWTCPKIKAHWKEVLLIIEEITGTKIPEEPWVCLFHGVSMSIKQYRRSLLPHLLNAAKSVIPPQWKDPESPSLKNCIGKINKIYNMEFLRFSCEIGEEGFERRWKDWVKYKQSPRYAVRMVEGR